MEDSLTDEEYTEACNFYVMLIRRLRRERTLDGARPETYWLLVGVCMHAAYILVLRPDTARGELGTLLRAVGFQVIDAAGLSMRQLHETLFSRTPSAEEEAEVRALGARPLAEREAAFRAAMKGFEEPMPPSIARWFRLVEGIESIGMPPATTA